MATVIFRTHESDAVVTKALALLSKPADEVVTTTGGLGRLATLQSGDQLRILGHGSTTTLGGYTAEQLAGVLAGAGLSSGISIDLVACNCGTGGAPFALELKIQLVAKKILPSTITAGTGYMWVKKDGTPFSKTKGGQEIATGRVQVNTPWGQRTRNVHSSYTTE